jgi:TRAP transporter TAXI family solute receptor
MKKFAIAAVALSAALAGAAFCGVAFAQQKTIAIGTGGTGGVYYPIGGGLANLLSKNLPGVQATAQVTGGSVDNLKLIGAGQSELAFTMADAALDAEKGQDKFKGNPVELRTLMVLYPNIMQIVTYEGSGIEKVADMKGKRVSTGSGGSATEVMAFRVIEAAGLDKDKDMKRERLGASESANALKDKKIDAFFFVAGVPTSAITDFGATPGVKIKMVDHADLVAKMNAKYGNLYSAATIKKGSYPGLEKDNQATAVWNLLVTGKSMSDQEAYNIVKLMVDKKADLVAVHKEANSFTVENQVKANSPLPWHPGAVKFFNEKGAKL